MKNQAFIIQLAGKKIYIKPQYGMIKEYCKEYLVADTCMETGYMSSGAESLPKVDLAVQISMEDIVYERTRSDREHTLNGQEPAGYSDAYLETLAVYRRIAEWMPLQETLLFHGSVIAVDGKAYMFTAKSGTGKSTHTRLWREYFGDRAVMVNDDKPLLRVTQEYAYAYGTPWDGKHRLSSNIHVPLAGICILKRAEKNSIRKITPYEAYPMLLQQCYRPKDTNALMATMRLLDRIKEKVPFYELFCNISQEAAEVAYQGMRGDKQ